MRPQQQQQQQQDFPPVMNWRPFFILGSSSSSQSKWQIKKEGRMDGSLMKSVSVLPRKKEDPPPPSPLKTLLIAMGVRERSRRVAAVGRRRRRS